jgi:hypothetical protein
MACEDLSRLDHRLDRVKHFCKVRRIVNSRGFVAEKVQYLRKT